MKSNDFDPVRDVTFRGRAIAKLDRDELLDALVQALWRLHELEQPARDPVFAPAHPSRPFPAGGLTTPARALT